MKTLELCKRELISKLKGNPLSILIIFISMVLSFTTLFPILSYLDKESERLTGINNDRAIFKFDAFPQDPQEAKSSLDAFEEIAFSGRFPKIKDCIEAPIFTLVSDSTLDISSSWFAFFGDMDCFSNDPALKESVIEGGWFTDEKFADRNDAAVVSINDYSDIKIGDRIAVNDSEYEVIALTQGVNVIPWSGMRENNTGESFFAFSEMRVQFVRPMTDAERESLSQYGFLSASSLDEITASSYLLGTILFIAIICGLLFIIIMNLRSLFEHIFCVDSYRYTVMKACGAGAGRLLAGIYLFPVLISSAAYIIGLLIHLLIIDKSLSEKLQYDRLTASEYLIVFAVTMIFLFIVLLPAALRLLKSNTADKRLWR